MRYCLAGMSIAIDVKFAAVYEDIANVKLKMAFLLCGFMLLMNSYTLELRPLVARF